MWAGKPDNVNLFYSPIWPCKPIICLLGWDCNISDDWKWLSMRSLWPLPALNVAKLHELRFLISLPLHNEAVVAPWGEVLWMPKVSQQRRIWWGCQAPSHQPATQRVALFNAPLLVSLNTSSLLVFTPCSQSLSLNDNREQKHYFLVLFLRFLPFCFSFSVPFLF